MDEMQDEPKLGEEAAKPAEPSADLASDTTVADLIANTHEEVYFAESTEPVANKDNKTIAEAALSSAGDPVVEPAPSAAVAYSNPSYSGEVGGIDILVQMASKGEIDPKNIDIIDVTDRFLKAIAQAPKENLRQSGKILFHASVLLRMKAEALLINSIDELDGAADDFADFDEDGALFYDANLEPIARQITLRDLERALVRRTHHKHLMQQRKVTLDQLIDALKEAERIERDRTDRRPKARIDLEGQPQVNDFSDILELAHDEDIEAVTDRVEAILAEFFCREQRILLVDLVKCLGKRNDWVDGFLAVLFLSNAGKIGLEQETFYGPLFLLPPAVANLEDNLARTPDLPNDDAVKVKRKVK